MNLLLRTASQIVNPLDSRRRFGFGSGVTGDAGFSPLSFAPVAWYDVSRLSLTNGDPISTLPDLSGNGWNMTSSGTARATFNSAGINGLGTADADGVDDGMISASVGSLSTWWVFMVVRPISTGGDRVFWAVDDYAPDTNFLLLNTGSGNQCRMHANTGLFSATMAAGSNHAAFMKGSSSGGEIIVSTGATATSANNFSKAASAMRLFRRGDGLYNSCRFGEGILGSGVLTTQQCNELFAYANTKWGTPIP